MKTIFQSIRMLLWMTFLTGLVYPLGLTLLGKRLFSEQVEGSLIIHQGHPVGSKWISQAFVRNEYFWPRPSAVGFNPLPSGGSNLGVTHPNFPKRTPDVPIDLVTASGSGLDPHISPEGALSQLKRIATARKLDAQSQQTLEKLLASSIEPPDLGILGEPRVNVLLLNLELDRTFPKAAQ